jgi:ATP-binding cassette subfamily B protein
LRELIGYVDQEPFLFSDTIRENITFGMRSIPEKEIDKAVAAAGLDRDLTICPHGLDTLIGERGVTLSGGQKQRVALARALIKKPKILILDDAFSNLDAGTEERVFTNIRDLFKDTTLIVISHRISIIRKSDTIALMSDGRTVEVGTHDDLVSQSGLYNRIYKQQLFLEKEIIEE